MHTLEHHNPTHHRDVSHVDHGESESFFFLGRLFSPFSRLFAAVFVLVDFPVADEKATLGFVGWGALETGEDAAEADTQLVAAGAAEAKIEPDAERKQESQQEQNDDKEEEKEEGEEATAEADA